MRSGPADGKKLIQAGGASLNRSGNLREFGEAWPSHAIRSSCGTNDEVIFGHVLCIPSFAWFVSEWIDLVSRMRGFEKFAFCD